MHTLAKLPRPHHTADRGFHRWLKALLSYRFDGFRVESETKPAHDADISWVSFGINNQPKDASSLALGSSRFLVYSGSGVETG